MTDKPTNTAIKVKFIDVNRHASDKSPWPLSSSVAFMTESADGISILFNERLSYMPGDKLYIKFDDSFGSANTDSN